MDSNNKKSLFQQLWDRKVPQYLGTYFAVGFGLLQFVEFITKRYDLSGNLVDKYLLVWLALVPAIITLIYFSDQLNPKTTSGVLKWPKYLVFMNVIIAFILGGILFNDKETDQAKIVIVKNENGKEITAVVPTLQKVKTIASFQFENLTGDADKDWWGVAFSNLLESDLDQRPEFYTYSQYGLHGYYDGMGLEPFTLPNIGMQREIAKKTRNDYFSRISYTIEDDKFIFNGKLYNSSDGNSVLSINSTNEDPFAAIDEIKQQIYDNIPNSFKKSDTETSLPSSSLITGNIEALKFFTKSRILFYTNPSALEEVVALAKKSVELDPTCSVCHYYIGDPLYGLGKRDEAILFIKKAIKYGASLPERMQFAAKETLYGITDNIDAYIKLQELRRKMFPYEFGPYYRLVNLYKTNHGIDSAKGLMQEAIANGNIEKGLLTLYDLQVENEEYLEAEETLNKFNAEFPDREQDRIKYADIYEKQGKIDKAKEILIEEETIDPLNTIVQTRLAYLDFKNLEIGKAKERVERGVAQSTTLTDSLNFLWIKAYFARMMGQVNSSLTVIEDYENFGTKNTPLNVMLGRTISSKYDSYLSVNKPLKVKELLKEINKYSPESEGAYACSVQAYAILWDYPTDINKDGLYECENIFEVYGEGYKRFYQILKLYHLGDYEASHKLIENNKDNTRQFFESVSFFIADIYLKVGDSKTAKDILQKAIDQKTDIPLYYYKMALLLEKENKIDAKKYLDIAMKYWSNADSDYIPAVRAKELAKRLLIYDANEG